MNKSNSVDFDQLERQLFAAEQEWSAIPCYQQVVWQETYDTPTPRGSSEPCGWCHICIRKTAIHQTATKYGAGLVPFFLAAEDLANVCREYQERGALPSSVRVALEDFDKAWRSYQAVVTEATLGEPDK